MKNLNIIIQKPETGEELTQVSFPSSSTASQSDQVQLNVSLVNFDNPVSVTFSFEFPDGSVLDNIQLMNSSEAPSVFTLSFTDIFNRHLFVGELNILKVTQININDDLVNYSLHVDDVYTIPLYKTNTNNSPTPTELEKVYILINQINKKLNELENK